MHHDGMGPNAIMVDEDEEEEEEMAAGEMEEQDDEDDMDPNDIDGMDEDELDDDFDDLPSEEDLGMLFSGIGGPPGRNRAGRHQQQGNRDILFNIPEEGAGQ